MHERLWKKGEDGVTGDDKPRILTAVEEIRDDRQLMTVSPRQGR